jgi:hypothetical protein
LVGIQSVLAVLAVLVGFYHSVAAVGFETVLHKGIGLENVFIRDVDVRHRHQIFYFVIIFFDDIHPRPVASLCGASTLDIGVMSNLGDMLDLRSENVLFETG